MDLGIACASRPGIPRLGHAEPARKHVRLEASEIDIILYRIDALTGPKRITAGGLDTTVFAFPCRERAEVADRPGNLGTDTSNRPRAHAMSGRGAVGLDTDRGAPRRLLEIRVQTAFLTTLARDAGLHGLSFPDGPLVVDDFVRTVVGLIEREVEGDLPGNTIALDSMVVQLALHLLRSSPATRLERPDAPQRAIGGLAVWQRKRVVTYMAEHLADDVRLGDLARLVGLSETHFCRAFGQSTGIAPRALLRKLRMQRAKELLATQAMPIAEIALEVGYGNQSSFGVAFRQATGLSPRAWQRRQDTRGPAVR